jgi:hypothetical protein
VYPLMARAGASVLADIGEQRLNARLGITAVLHTWASNLTLHPHWHMLVTAGGLSLDGQCVSAHANPPTASHAKPPVVTVGSALGRFPTAGRIRSDRADGRG